MNQSKLSIKKLFEYFKIAIAGKEENYTSGSIKRAIFMLSIPMILEMLMEATFALVDMIYVSRISTNAIATVNSTFFKCRITVES
jgi:Na+-driven multidrug efflux pump